MQKKGTDRSVIVSSQRIRIISQASKMNKIDTKISSGKSVREILQEGSD